MSLSKKMRAKWEKQQEMERQRQREDSIFKQQQMVYDQMLNQKTIVSPPLNQKTIVTTPPSPWWATEMPMQPISQAVRVWPAINLGGWAGWAGDRDVFKPDAVDATHATDSRVPPPGIPRRLTRILGDAAAGIYPFTSPRLDHTQEAAVWMPGLEDMVDDWPDRA